jgi:serine/threonine protein kinase
MGEAELRELLAGIEVVHDRATLHRDLKPNNIILRDNGTPVLIDFGAARDFASRHSRSITAIAAPGYSPPEQYGAGGEQGPWTDLYALGAIAYRAVTGATPVDSLRRLRKDPLVPAALAAPASGQGRYSEELMRTIDWMLAIYEADRPQSAHAVREALKGGVISKEVGKSSVSSVKITAAAAGRTILEFDHAIDADVLELAFFVTARGEYLVPSTNRGPAWRKSPHFFPLCRVQDAPGGAVFEAGPEISNYIADKSEVTVSSRDGFILFDSIEERSDQSAPYVSWARR